MAFKNFVKDNIVLLAGIFLPVLLVVFFILSSAIPRMMTEPPAYDFLFSWESYRHVSEEKFSIRLKVNDNGLLVASVIKNEQPQNYYPTLYRYSAKDGFAVEVKDDYLQNYIIDHRDELTDKSVIPLPKSIADLKLNDEVISPDGYTLDSTYHYRGGGFVGEIFYMRNQRCMYRLMKKNATFPFEIRQIDDDNYGCRYSPNNLKFLGWIVPEE